MQYSVFGSILTFGAMIGAITSGPIADFIGRKGVSMKNYRFRTFNLDNFLSVEYLSGMQMGRQGSYFYHVSEDAI